MTPNKSDSVCDCIYGDGACDKHSDSGELRRILDSLGFKQANDGTWWADDWRYEVTKEIQSLTAHIQAVGEEIIGMDDPLPKGPRYAGKTYVICANELRAEQRKRLAQYLGDKQDD